MPTNQNAYNSRVTDESLEKKFRDTFTSQGGAELVNDLYASGVIVPIVDFSAAASGDTLGENLQTAWDFATGQANLEAVTQSTIINTSGFWKVQAQIYLPYSELNAQTAILEIADGTPSYKKIFQVQEDISAPSGAGTSTVLWSGIVFLRALDSLVGTAETNTRMIVNYRQIADVNGNLTNPLGFTSS